MRHDSLPVSIPLFLIPQRILTKLNKNRSTSLPDLLKDIEGIMPPPKEQNHNRLHDAQLLVAFSKEARDKQAVIPKPAFAVAKDLPNTKKYAIIPEDLPNLEPDEPKPAKVFVCNAHTQTEGEENDLIEIIKLNNITRRQLLRLVGNVDNNNNNDDVIISEVIEIIDTPDDNKESRETLLKEIKAQSDHQKNLIMKHYNTVKAGHKLDVYDFINKFLVVNNTNSKEDLLAIENNVPAIDSNVNNKNQSGVSPPEAENSAGSSEATANNNYPEQSPAPPQQPDGRAAAAEITPLQQVKAANYHMMRLYQLMSPAMQQAFASGWVPSPSNFPALPAPAPAQAGSIPTNIHLAAGSFQQCAPNFQQVRNTFQSIPASQLQQNMPTQATPVANNYPQNVFPNIGNVTSPGNCIQPNQLTSPQFSPTLPGMFQATLPNTYDYNTRFAAETRWQSGMTQVPVVPQAAELLTSTSSAKRGRARRVKATPTRGPNVPSTPPFQGPLYNKYKFMMGQQKLQEMQRQQRAWQSQQHANYPNAAWGQPHF